jgi:hypothetical protein
MPNKRSCAAYKSGCTRSAQPGYRLDPFPLVLGLAPTKFRASYDEPPERPSAVQRFARAMLDMDLDSAQILATARSQTRSD